MILGKDVSILMASETGSITIQLETIEDAIVFAAYVELLVDISNTGRTVKLNEIVEKSESYFENKDILSPRVQWKEKRLN